LKPLSIFENESDIYEKYIVFFSVQLPLKKAGASGNPDVGGGKAMQKPLVEANRELCSCQPKAKADRKTSFYQTKRCLNLSGFQT